MAMGLKQWAVINVLAACCMMCWVNPLVAATITVTSDNNSGAGSLRAAITSASSGDTINFSNDYTIVLTSGQLEITKSLTIDGEAHTIVVSGNNASRVVQIDPSITVTLQNLTIENGNAGGEFGGGIYNNGALAITNCIVSGNHAPFSGGIYNNTTGTLTLTDCTISGNTAANGGGIYNENSGVVMVSKSTVSGNSARNDLGYGGGYGGGIYINTNGTVIVNNSTIAGNSAAQGGGFFIAVNGSLLVNNGTLSGNSASSGGGMHSAGGTVMVNNSIIAGSGTPGANCFYNSGSAGGINNLSDDNTCYPDFTDSPSLLLGTLGNYGGPTQTIPLLPGSAALDAGTTGGCPATDQRGIARPQVLSCDIGAFESQGFILAASGGNNQTAPINTAFATRLSVTITANDPAEPVDGSPLTFTSPASGASAAIWGSPATITGGSASVTAFANNEAGGYQVTVGTRGAASINFSLTNLPTTTTTVNATAEGFQYTEANGVITITGYTCAAGTLVIPDTVNGYTVGIIADDVFKDCTDLTSVTIPAGVIRIGDDAFNGCSGLTAAYFGGNAPSMGERVFDGCASGFTIYYLRGSTGFTNPWHGYPTAVERDCPAKNALGADKTNLDRLRYFRDRTLAQSAIGRKVIDLYYKNAESITGELDRSQALKYFARMSLEILAPLVGKN